MFSLPSCVSLRIKFQILGSSFYNTAYESYLPKLRHLELELPDDSLSHRNEHVAFLLLITRIPTCQLLSLKITMNSSIQAHFDIERLFREIPFDNLRSLQVHYTPDRVVKLRCSAKRMPVLEHLEIHGLADRRGTATYLSDARSLTSLKPIRINCATSTTLGEYELLQLVECLSDSAGSDRIGKVQLRGLEPSLRTYLGHIIPKELSWCELL